MTGDRVRPPRVRAAAPPAPKARTPWRPLLIVLAGCLAYANGLRGPFILDDQNSIIDNIAIRHLSSVGSVLQQHDTPIAGRPVAAFSLALDYSAGRMSVVPYHVTNVAIHLLCALLVFGIARRTLTLGRAANPRDALDIAFAIGLIWVVHPLNTEVVDYVTQRTESLMACFLLLTLYAAIRSGEPGHAGWWQTVAVVACGAGMGSKESMVVAPVVVVTYDRCYRFALMGEAFRSRGRLYGMLAGTWVVLLFCLMPGPRSGSTGLTPGESWLYLTNQAPMIARYVGLAFWPSELVVNYGRVVESLRARDVLLSATVVIGLLIASVVVLVRNPRLGFLGAWIFLTLAPTSSVIPIVTEVGAERRMYVPLIAIIAIIVIGAHRIAGSRLSRATAVTALAAVTLALGLATTSRNREYSSGLSLAESALRRWPTDVAHGMVGAELMSLHRHEEALRELRVAARTDSRSRYNLGAELFNIAKFDDAVHELTGLAEEYPMRQEALWARRLAGRAYASQRDWPHAIVQLTLAQSMSPSDGETRRLLVDSLSRQGVSLAETNHADQAAVVFRRAVLLDPTQVTLRHDLAAALLDSGDPEAAERQARQAIAIAPADAESYEVLGRALALQGKTGDAIAQLRRALELSPHDPRIEDDLVRTLAAVKR
jgi:Flp pilus assembly protein TadD